MSRQRRKVALLLFSKATRTERLQLCAAAEENLLRRLQMFPLLVLLSSFKTHFCTRAGWRRKPAHVVALMRFSSQSSEQIQSAGTTILLPV